MPLAVITLDFDPTLEVGGWTVPWITVGIGVAIFVALLAAAIIAGRTPAHRVEPDAVVRRAGVRHTGGLDPRLAAVIDGPEDLPDDDPGPAHLRRDDILLIALGALPGAVVAGRLVYALDHLDYFRAVPGSLLDPSVGSLSLSGAVVGGIVTGAAVVHLLGPSLERWMRVAAVPLLLGLALGKGAQVLSGSGQGSPSDGPLALRFAGAWAWPDPMAGIPAQPSQLFEAGATLLVLLVVALLATTRAGRSGVTVFGLAVALWALARAVVAASWRDPVVVGEFRAEQLVCLAIAAISLGVVLVVPLASRRRRRGDRRAFDTA